MTTSARPATASDVLRRPVFWLLWPAQLISTFGSSLAALAATIVVYTETRSALAVGLMLIAAALPGLVVGLSAAQLLARVPRKAALLATGIARVALLALIPALLPHGIVWIYLLMLLESAATQLYDPAFAGALADLTSTQELAAAHQLLLVGRFVATAVGFAAAGLLASQSILLWAFYLDAATCALSALAIMPMRLRRGSSASQARGQAPRRSRVLASLDAALHAIGEEPALRSLLVISLPAFVGLGLTNALLLPFTQRALHATWWQYGLQEALTALGFLLGSLILARLAARFHEGQLLVVAFVGIGLAYVEYAQLSSIPLALGLMLLAGVFNAPSVVGRTQLIQRHSARATRGQVMTFFFVVRSICFLLGMAAAGLADLFPVRAVLLVAGIVLVVVGALALVAPGLRQSAAEWRSGLRLLRRARTAPGLGAARKVTAADMDVLSRRWLVIGELSLAHLQRLVNTGRVYDVAPGTRIVRAGEHGNTAYLVLRGRVVVGLAQDGLLASSVMLNAGDIFGEVAALTGAPRTADVVAARPSEVLEVPAATLRELMREEGFGRIVLARMTARLAANQGADLPRGAGSAHASLAEHQAEGNLRDQGEMRRAADAVGQ